MFDNNVFKKNSFKNIQEENKIMGYQIETLITYYRAIPLSMVEFIKVSVDGVEENSENILISIDEKDWFTLKEAETVTTYKWEYGEPLFVRVLKEGGLTTGEHDIKLTVAVRTAYIPVPLVGSKERRIAV